MKGGFLDNISSTLSQWGTSISQGASEAWQKTKSAVSGTTTPSAPVYTSPTTTSFGGRGRNRKHRGGTKHRGGFKDNTSTTGLAAHAASFSGQTAQPKTIVGGKTRRRGRKGGFLGEVINQSVVPLTILGLQQTYKRRRGGKTRKHRR
jgi:hypothetical protein